MNDMIEFIDRYLAGELTDAQFDALCVWLREDPSHFEMLVRHSMLEQGLSEFFQSEETSQIIEALKENDEGNLMHDSSVVGVLPPSVESAEDTQSAKPYIAAPSDLDTDRPHQIFSFAGVRIYHRRGTGGGGGMGLKHWAWAALVAIAAGVAWVTFTQKPVEPEPELVQAPAKLEVEPVIATLTRSLEAQWQVEGTDADVQALTVGAELRPSRLSLTDGFVELTMKRGATVLLEAPATLDLLDENRVRLSQGKLVADVPEQAKWFTVDTLTAEIIDLGTQFGVEAGLDGQTTAAVFKGVVEMSEVASPQRPEPRKVMISRNWQASVSSEGRMDDMIESLDPSHRFIQDWHTAMYRPEITEQGLWLKQIPESVTALDLFDPQRIAVFLERADVEVDQPLKGWINMPGTYSGNALKRAYGLVPQGEVVDSYLIHKAGGTDKGANQSRRFTTVIRFPREIVGVQTRTELLIGTDTVFAAPDTRYHRQSGDAKSGMLWRGLDPRSSFDRVVISEDRRTIEVSMDVKATMRDQVRVLIKAAEPEELLEEPIGVNDADL